MRKKYLKGIVAGMIVGAVVVCGKQNVRAEIQYVYFEGKHKMGGGVGDYGDNVRKYWISPDFSSFYYDCAKDAMSDWSNNSLMVEFERTSSRPTSAVDIYETNDGEDAGYNAYTMFRKNASTTVNPNKQNWKYAQIYYNLDNPYKKDKSKNKNKIIAVFAHELGHAFGLDENNKNQNSIMCQAGSGRKVTKVQVCDFIGVYLLYK